MTHGYDTILGALPGLPDPERDPQFYQGVPTRRLFAWFVDLFVVLLVGVPAALVFGLVTLGFGFAIFPLVIMGIGLVYRTLTIGNRSATWGMRVMGIELRRRDGSRFDLATAFLHTVLYTICLGAVVLQVLSILGMVGTRYGQGLPDLVLRTAMINRPAD